MRPAEHWKAREVQETGKEVQETGKEVQKTGKEVQETGSYRVQIYCGYTSRC